MKLITQIDGRLRGLVRAARDESTSWRRWPLVEVEMTPAQAKAHTEDSMQWLLHLARRAERKAFVAGWKAAKARIEREAKQP